MIDQETEKRLGETYKSYRLVHDEHWQEAKAKLQAHMAAVDSISLLDTSKSNEQVGEIAKVNKKAQTIVLTWLADVEGDAEQYLSLKAALEDQNKEPMILHL